jgi:PAS domain S-box-containing protein
LDLVNNRLTWSDEVYRIFGLQPQEFDATYEAFLDALHPEDRAVVDAAYSGSVREGKDAYEIEHRGVKKSTGKVRMVHKKCEYIRDASGRIIMSLGMVHYITERKRAEESLRESESEQRRQREFLECLIANAGSCIAVVKGRELRYTVANPAFQAVAAGAPMVGRTYREVFPEGAAAGAEARVRRVLDTGEPWIVEAYQSPVPGKPDATWQGHVVRLPLVADEEPSALVVVWDITERKKAEESLKKAHDELEIRVRERTSELSEAVEKLRVENIQRKRAEDEVARSRAEVLRGQRLTRLSGLTASLSHELNQPLAAILSSAQAALRFLQSATPDLDLFRTILENIVEDNKRAAGVIRSLRSLVKKELKEKESLNMNEVLGDFLPLFRSEAVIRNVEIKTDFDNSLPPVFGDRVQLQQVVLNLVMNAAEAMSQIPPEQRRITLRTHATDIHIQVTVRDFGPGIDSAKLHDIWQPFFTTKDAGLGIGLSVCTSIVQAHGGRIWAENNPDGGATFFFELPVSQ